MRRAFSWLLFAALQLICVSSQAQNAKLAGFVFANAIGVSGNADLTANGRKLTNKGVPAGAATSGLGLEIGSYSVQVTAPGCVPATAPVQLAEGSTPILVAYRERTIDPRSSKPQDVVKTLQLPAQPQKQKFSLTVVSVDPAGRFTATAGGRTQGLEFGKPVNFESKTLKIADATGASAEAEVDEKASYYCFLFHTAEGKPTIVTVPQQIYTW